MKNYKIFISHSWKYGKDYYTIEEWLDNAFGNKWQNMSVPEHDAIECTSNLELEEKINNKIKNSSGVIIISGMYVNYSEWINKEIKMALNFNKSMIGIKPRGNEKVPSIISTNTKLVNWNSTSVINAIKENF